MRKTLLALLILTACGRGLTDTERALMTPIMGDTFSADHGWLRRGSLAWPRAPTARARKPRVVRK